MFSPTHRPNSLQLCWMLLKIALFRRAQWCYLPIWKSSHFRRLPANPISFHPSSPFRCVRWKVVVSLLILTLSAIWTLLCVAGIHSSFFVTSTPPPAHSVWKVNLLNIFLCGGSVIVIIAAFIFHDYFSLWRHDDDDDIVNRISKSLSLSPMSSSSKKKEGQ